VQTNQTHMKTTIQLSHLIRIGSLLLVLAAAVSPARAATTGQWDFDAGDLSATIGLDLGFRDGDTQSGTQFGTTTTFGIANINGEVAKVMKFPKTLTINGGYAFYPGANANGGGNLLNQYTIVMDVYFPSGSSGKNRALVQTDAGGNAEFFVNSGNGIGADGGPFTGNVTPDEWHRLAFAVDLAANPAVVAKFIDGVKVGEDSLSAGPAVDSRFAVSPFDAAFFNDDSGETEVGYVNSLQIRDEKMSDVLVAALGGPTAAGILTGPPPNPYFVSLDPSPETARIPSRSTVSPRPQIQVVIEDGQTALDTASVRLQIDSGSIVTPTAVKVGTTTTVTYTPPGFLSPGLHRASISFSDDSMPPKSLGTQWQFAVGPYVGLPAEAAGPLGSGNTPGFLVRTAQASTTNVIPNVNSFGRAIRQLNGTLTDTDGVIVPNLAFAGPNPDGSYNADTINFHLSGPDVGVFTSDLPFPGIPGIEGSRNVFATEVVGFLELTAGVHHLGVSVSTARTDSNDDDGYTLYGGKDARNILSTVVGSFFRGNDVPAFATSFTTNDFTIVAPVDGIYSYRLVHFQNGDDASLEFYSIDDATGQKILINDPADGRAIKAYRFSTAPFSNKPYVAQIDPTPGGSGVSPLLPIQVLVIDALTQLDLNSVQLSLNGTSVSAATSKVKVNGRTTINYQPNATRTNPTNQLHLGYSDNSSPSPLSFTNDWAFTSAINAVGQNTVSGQWDFNFCDLSATIGKPLQYFDGPNGATAQTTVFGTCASLGVPLINGENANIMQVSGDTGPGSRNLAYVMDHGIKPNGGGTRVNQYTLIYDVMIASTGAGAASMLQVTDPDVNVSDGDLFWQGNNFGQGANGYIGTGAFTPGAWHRVIAAYDEAASPPVVTKYVDGIKQDDWTANQGLDNNRRAMLPTALLFADGDQDERRQWWVSSVQVREGKLTDAQMAALGGPSANKIPVVIPETTVTGQWDFDQGNLAATVGKPLQYFDGPTGATATETTFGTCSSMGVALINGQDAHIMHVPGETGPGSRNLAYIMDHGIKPNGGGTRVNQYTLIYDVMVGTTGAGAASMLQVTDPDVNLSDGDLFWQGNNFGQGGNGYIGTGAFTPGAWHRVIAAYNEAAIPPVVTKYVDGIFQDDWTANQGLDNNRRAMLPTALLFADGDQDERREWWVDSIQVRAGALSKAEMAALGGASGNGIPVSITLPLLPPAARISSIVAGSNLRLSWPASLTGYTLESTPSLSTPSWQPVGGVVGNCATVPISAGPRFYRLRQ